MFAHLSKTAERVVKRAQQMARELGVDYVGTEHILLAIVAHEGCAGQQLLARRGIDLTRVKRRVAQLIRKSKEETWVFGRLPGSPHFRNVMARAVEEAQRTTSKSIGTHHLLLGLMREPGSVAHSALAGLGLDLEDARREITGEQPIDEAV
jgi:ATP-dependent Clp protease ATP-binding subunit ClpC